MEKILVLDDDLEMARAVGSVLEGDGYDVDMALDAHEAIGMVRTSPYQLVITDLRMDKTDGIEVMQQVHASAPGTPVVIMTAYGTVQCAVEAMKLGAQDFILKPFAPEALQAVVNKALDTRREISAAADRSGFLTRDPRTKQLVELAVRIARCDSTVLVTGESGTGKEVLAKLIHAESRRSHGPFVAVNCAAIPDNLLESELFGYEKGAFTGAVASKPGKFELAHGGTLLLDEIGEMSILLQAKLLRVLQEREVDRIGSRRPVPVDIRVIATTNKDLGQLVKSTQFREDLYFRLNVVPLRLTPLRERRGDVQLLADAFLKKAASPQRLQLGEDALRALDEHAWPGNVRELQNMIHRALAICDGPVIRTEDLFPELSPPEQKPGCGLPGGPMTIDAMERELIMRTLHEKNGNRTHAARALGISLRTLRNKLRDYRLEQ